MTYRSDEDNAPRSTKGPGWLHDERDRRYRDENGTRHYATIDERDSAIEERWRIPGKPEGLSTLAWIYAEAPALAEEFCRVSKPSGAIGATLRFWEVRRFGAELEPAAHRLLLGEIRRQTAGQHRLMPSLSVYDSLPEQHRFEAAAAKVCAAETGPLDSERRIGAIVKAATGKALSFEALVRGMRMPYAPGSREWERRQNEQKAALSAREPGSDDE